MLRGREHWRLQLPFQQWKEQNVRRNLRLKYLAPLLIMWFSNTIPFVIWTTEFNLRLEKKNKIAGKLLLVFSSKESARVGARVFLVPVSVCQPHTQDLCKTEEEADATNKPQNLASILSNYGGTWGAFLVTFSTASWTGVIWVIISEATAVQIPLDVISSTCCIVPSNLQELTLLLPIQS